MRMRISPNGCLNSKKAAAELPLGQVSDPVKTDYGYHVMKVESRTTKKLDDVKADIKSGLAEQQIYNFAEKELPGMIETNNLPSLSLSSLPSRITADKRHPVHSSLLRPHRLPTRLRRRIHRRLLRQSLRSKPFAIFTRMSFGASCFFIWILWT